MKREREKKEERAIRMERKRHRCMKTMMKYCERGTNISSFLPSSNQIQDLLLFLSSSLPVEVSEEGWKNMKRIFLSLILRFVAISLSLSLSFVFLSIVSRKNRTEQDTQKHNNWTDKR